MLAAAGTPVEINVVRQPSRLYGHNLADLIALSAIALLAGVEGLEKFEAATALLRQKPEAVDLPSKMRALVKACGASLNRSGSRLCVASESPTEAICDSTTSNRSAYPAIGGILGNLASAGFM